MLSNCTISLLVVFFIFGLLAFVFVQRSGDENFHALPYHGFGGYSRYSSPYYTTTFQAYPGKYMIYSSARNSYCLQQHQEYAGYRNCMLYFEN